jgi:hypothetical protein
LEDIRKGNTDIAQVILDVAYISLMTASPLLRWQRAFQVLFLDLSRQTPSLGVLSDFDASAAFDRVLGSLSVLTCERVGLPGQAGQFMYSLLKNMNFHLITGFRKSADSFYNSENGETGQGVLQGSSSAAPNYILTSDISLLLTKKRHRSIVNSSNHQGSHR